MTGPLSANAAGWVDSSWATDRTGSSAPAANHTHNDTSTSTAPPNSIPTISTPVSTIPTAVAAACSSTIRIRAPAPVPTTPVVPGGRRTGHQPPAPAGQHPDSTRTGTGTGGGHGPPAPGGATAGVDESARAVTVPGVGRTGCCERYLPGTRIPGRITGEIPADLTPGDTRLVEVTLATDPGTWVWPVTVDPDGTIRGVGDPEPVLDPTLIADIEVRADDGSDDPAGLRELARRILRHEEALAADGRPVSVRHQLGELADALEREAIRRLGALGYRWVTVSRRAPVCGCCGLRTRVVADDDGRVVADMVVVVAAPERAVTLIDHETGIIPDCDRVARRNGDPCPSRPWGGPHRGHPRVLADPTPDPLDPAAALAGGDPGFDIEVVTDPARCREVLGILTDAGRPVGVDTETEMIDDNRRWVSPPAVTVQLAHRSDTGRIRAWVIPADLAAAVADDPRIGDLDCWAWNVNFDSAVLAGLGWEPRRWRDLMLDDALLCQGAAGWSYYRPLAAAVTERLGLTLTGKDTVRTGFRASEELTDQQIVYAAMDAAVLIPLGEVLATTLIRERIAPIAETEHRAARVVRRFSRTGLVFDKTRWDALLDEYALLAAVALEELARLTDGGRPWPFVDHQPFGDPWRGDDDQRAARLLQAAGAHNSAMDLTGGAGIQGTLFDTDTADSPDPADIEVRMIPGWNPASAVDVRNALNTWAADAVRAVNGGRLLGGNDRADKLLLAQIDHPLAAALLRWREAVKMLTTYGVGFQAKGEDTGDGRIVFHPEYQQALVDSGRLSSSNPNAQNLPDPIKGLIRPSRDDRVFVYLDVGRAEMWLMGVLTGDQLLRDAFCSGADLHERTAARMFGVDMGQLKTTDPARYKELRSKAKTLNFGLAYGMRAPGLATRLSASGYPTTVEEATELLDRFMASFPTLSGWLVDRDTQVNLVADRLPDRVDYRGSWEVYRLWRATADIRREAARAGEAVLSPEEVLARMGGPPDGAEETRVLRALAIGLRNAVPVLVDHDGHPVQWESRTPLGRRRIIQITVDDWATAMVLGALRNRQIAVAVDRALAAGRWAHKARLAPARFGERVKLLEDRALRDDIVDMLIDRWADHWGAWARDAARARMARTANALRNHPIQGGIADLVLDAMGRLADALENEPDIVPVTSVHDSVILECPAEAAERAARILVRSFRDAFARMDPSLPVELDVDIRAGYSDSTVIRSLDARALAAGT